MVAAVSKRETVIPGWLLMLGVAVISQILSKAIVVEGSHPVEAIVVAIILGVALRNVNLVPKICYRGISKFEKVLVWEIVLLGASLTLGILKIEPYALVVLAVTMLVGFWSIYFLAKKVGFGEKLGTLLAVGTTICGGTAIHSTPQVVGAGYIYGDKAG